MSSRNFIFFLQLRLATKSENKQEASNNQNGEKNIKDMGLKYFTPICKIVPRGYFDMVVSLNICEIIIKLF